MNSITFATLIAASSPDGLVETVKFIVSIAFIASILLFWMFCAFEKTQRNRDEDEQAGIRCDARDCGDEAPQSAVPDITSGVHTEPLNSDSVGGRLQDRSPSGAVSDGSRKATPSRNDHPRM